ncbi:MAG TPA: 30S ribosomal protein S18 [Candidatus Omnitrophota bacterium]|nr:30S ribosomal protein S18 [Candidatus Omnitrophota bacterium]HPS20667.1 30S ribosomal protein S18 [Candidatus Omnitrophota bacterium]
MEKERIKKPGNKKLKMIRKKPCRLCRSKVKNIDFKNIEFLEKFITDRGKITPSRITGNCAKHQRMVANKVKRARIAGLLPFVKIKRGV